jgi:hypothetical protein
LGLEVRVGETEVGTGELELGPELLLGGCGLELGPEFDEDEDWGEGDEVGLELDELELCESWDGEAKTVISVEVRSEGGGGETVVGIGARTGDEVGVGT